LKSRNYKVFATVGFNTVVARPVRAILDTGAGPNLVRAELLPHDWERYRVKSDPPREIVGAGGRRLKQLGVVVLHVELGRLRARCRFTVVPGLVAEFILGCQFIELHVIEILPKEKKIRLTDRTIVHILQDSGDVPPSTSVEAPKPSVRPRRSE
jgi:Aspartyl protease